ncbi:hypothetical protein [Glaciecola sp. SC05]|uniref:hypothetical protein n=1 Tax=Glaciecola sp. SC05 TaxID=1987355 RepID=UPI0035270CCA
MSAKKHKPIDLTPIHRKRKKLLTANVSCLTRQSINETVTWCYEDINDYFRAITMLCLCTGWSVKKLLSSSTLVRPHKVNDVESVGLLRSSWSFSEFSPNATNQATFESVLREFYIPFPFIFFHALKRARQLELVPIDVEKLINQNLAKLKNAAFQKVTINRLQQHILQTCHHFDLSSSDIDFITDKDKASSPHSHYGHRSLAIIYSGLKQYVDSLHIGVASNDSCLPTIETNNSLGGNRVVSDKTVKELFNFLVNRRNSKADSLEQIEVVHNNYTTFVISILQLCTLLRPTRMNSVLLNHFEFGFKSLVIEDKGARSKRRIPICAFGQQTLQNYVNYLNAVSKKCRFLPYEISNKTDKAYKSLGPLFHYFGTTAISAYTPTTHTGMIFGQYYDLPKNWSRHKVKTVLLDAGSPPAHVKRFMGHVEDFEFNEGKFHTTNYADLVQISIHINDWLESLGVENWKPQI